MKALFFGLLLMIGGCSAPTNPLLLDLVTDEPNVTPPSVLYVSVFDATHALVLQQPIPVGTLQGQLLLGGLPGNEELRIVVVGIGGSARLLGAVVGNIPAGAQAEYPILLDSMTLDSDNDGVPDQAPTGNGTMVACDNCPFTFNPDQQSASGGPGDACKNNDFSVTPDGARDFGGEPDLSIAGVPDLSTAD